MNKILYACAMALAAALLGSSALAATNEPAGPIQLPVVGKVVETKDAGVYTYVLVRQTNRDTWVASGRFEARVGDEINVAHGSVMKDFKSKSLNRTFDWILFAPTVVVNGGSNKKAEEVLPPGHPPLASNNKAEEALPPGHPPLASSTDKPAAATPSAIEVKKGSVQKVHGGLTVEECYAKKKKFNGKPAKVRGVVVKVAANIMGKNWVHIQDGTGAGETSDLVLTTQESVKTGEVIVVEGKLACDKDFGAGYKYAVLLEDAVILK